MSVYLEPLLAAVGFAFLVAVSVGALAAAWERLRDTEAEMPTPYRDGLDAAARISAAAFAAERELHLAAERARREEEWS